MLYVMVGVVSSFMHMVLIGEQSMPPLGRRVEDFELLCVYMSVFIVISLVKSMNESYYFFFLVR